MLWEQIIQDIRSRSLEIGWFYSMSKHIQDSVRYIQNLAYDKLNQLQIEARQYAVEKLDWSQSVEILHGILSKQS